MKKQAVKHQPVSNDAFVLDEKTLVFRIRTAKDDIKEVLFCYGDTAYQGNPVKIDQVKMVKVASDLLFDYYEIVLSDIYERVVYYFSLNDGLNIYYYYADFFHTEVSLERNDLYKLPYHRKEDVIDIPSWLEEAIVYNIFPDSFIDHKRAQTKENVLIVDGKKVKNKLGGTIKEIINHLDYIEDLGANVVYINPIFMGGEYHKYDTIDYFRIDPHFGSKESFKQLVDECHNRNMKVIIDGVFNHSGWYFFAFDDVVKHQQDSQYVDWFYCLDFPVYRPEELEEQPPYACFGYERKMPKLNTSNPEVINYLMEVNRFWIEEFDIDGWRLDVADEVDDNFWRVFKKVAKYHKKDIAIIGEVWQSAERYLDNSMFDSTMNYDFLKYTKAFFAKDEIDAERFDARITHLRLRYRTPFTYAQLNMLDSHDVPRFLSHCREDIQRFKLAVVFQLTFLGVPSIFYGDEQGLSGIKESEYRRPMEFDKNNELKMFYRQLIQLRKQESALVKGHYQTVYAKENQGLYIFDRCDQNIVIRVLLNNQQKDIAVSYDQGEILMSSSPNQQAIEPYGFKIIKMGNNGGDLPCL